MPRVALTAAQRRQNAAEQVRKRFKQKLGLSCSMYDLTEGDICASLKMSRGTFISRKKNPDEFRMQEIKALCDVLHWSGAVRDYIWHSGADPDQLTTGGEKRTPVRGLNVG